MLGGSWGRQKPPVGSVVNKGHPLAVGLSPCYLLNENAGTPSSVIKDASGRGVNPSFVEVSWVPGRNGPCVALNGITNSVKFTPSITAKPLTIAALFSPSDQTTIGTVAALSNSGTTNSHARIVVNVTTGKVTFNTIDSSGTQLNITSGTLAASPWHLAIGVIPATGLASFYVDGVLQGTSAQQSYNAFTVGTLGILRYSTDIQAFLGRVDSAYFYNRAFTPTDVLNLTNNIYAMIQPPPATKFYSYASPATGNRRRRILCAGSIA